MGAYSNPEVAKDYTAEIVGAWSSAANELTGDIIKNIQASTSEYEALSKKYIANRQAVEQNKLALLKDLGKNTNGYLGNDWQDTFKDAIDKYAELNLKIANNVGTPEERAQFQRELSSIESTIDLTKQGIVTLASYGDGADKQLATAGEQGGYALEGDPNVVNALLCGNGKISGKRQIIVSRDENGVWGSTFTFSGDLGGGKSWNHSFAATKVNEISKNGNNIAPIVPVIDNSVKSLAKESNLFTKETKTVDGKPVSEVKGPDINKYYKNEGEVKIRETDDSQTFANKRVFQSEIFKKDLLASPEFTAEVEGLTSNLQGMVATLNNTFRKEAPEYTNEKGEKITNGIWTLDMLKDPQKLAEAQKLYTDSFADYITKNQRKEIYDTDPISGKVIENTSQKDAVSTGLKTIERSFGEGQANANMLEPGASITTNVPIGKNEVKVKITKDKNNKVTVKRVKTK